MTQRIAIVGAGLAGLAAAAAAAAAGAQVDVFEAEARLAAPPAHLNVLPAMLRDLVGLGVGEACVRQGFAYQGMAVVDPAGQPRFEIETPPLAGTGWPAAIGMHYATLLQVLHDAACARGARLHWGLPVARLAWQPEGSLVFTADGTAWPCDLALVAGARGVAGIGLPLAEHALALPQRWDHVLLPRPPRLDRPTWVVGPGRSKALLVPISTVQAGVAVLREPAAERTAASLRAHLLQRGPLLAAAARHVADDARVISRPVHSGLLAGAWHEGAALRIGSSAHLLPPHFGQAAAQSVEDAAVLRDLLQAGLPVAALLSQFMQRRGERAGQVHAVADQAAQWDLQPNPETDLPALARRLAPIVERAA